MRPLPLRSEGDDYDVGYRLLIFVTTGKQNLLRIAAAGRETSKKQTTAIA
jgi:hypothetical protein